MVECVGGAFCVDKKKMCRHCYRWQCKLSANQQKSCQKGEKKCAEHFRQRQVFSKRPRKRCRPRPPRQRCRRRRRRRPTTMAKNKYPLPTLSRRTMGKLEIKSKSQRQQHSSSSNQPKKILEKRTRRRRKRLPLMQSNKPKLRSYASRSRKKLEQYFDITHVPDYTDFLPIYLSNREKRLWKRQAAAAAFHHHKRHYQRRN